MDKAIEKYYDELLEIIKKDVVDYLTYCDESKAIFEESKGKPGDSGVQQRAHDATRNREYALRTVENDIMRLQPFAILKQSELQAEQKAILANLSEAITQQVELQAEQKRILERMEAESQKQSKHNKRAILITGGIAVLAVAISVFLGILSLHSSRTWQQEQIPILKEIRDRPPVVVERQVEKPVTKPTETP